MKRYTYYAWFVLLAFLAACGQQPANITPTEVDVNAISTQAAATAKIQLTQIAASQPTATMAPTAAWTETPAPLPSPTSLPLFPLDGYVMLFTKDGDLYFQDGSNAPVKLAHVGEKSYYPKLSDDNQKVVFHRSNGNTYSINTDGTQERVVIPNDWLAAFEPGTTKGILGFIPGTHQLFFETILCELQKFGSLCSTSIFLTDTDTGDIKKLADLGLSLQQNGLSRNIEISPDGKMVAVGTMEGMDIFTMDGNMIRHDILPYTPSSPSYNFFSLFSVQFWLPDSSGLIIAIPDTTNHIVAYGIVPAYSVWRYMINDDVAIQIPLDPSPMLLYGCDKFQVSPDGNWILYGGSGDYASSLYVGNLGNGHTQLYDSQVCPYFSWSPDSKHFLYGNSLGTMDKPPVSIKNIHPLKWIDISHFIYFEPLENIPEAEIKVLIAEIRGETILSYVLGLFLPDLVIIKPK